MTVETVTIKWPNGNLTKAKVGSDWLKTAFKAGFHIPTGCLSGSCGACEIEVNGQIVRACISSIEGIDTNQIVVDIASDPYW